MAKEPVMQGATGAEVVIEGNRCLYFSGTAYLGLQGRAEVIRAACEAAERYGIGAATARTGFGNQPPTLQVEAAAADYFGQEAAFYYPSGYAGPGVILGGLCDEFNAIWIDEQSHYAGFEGVKLTGKNVTTFRHREPGDLSRKLRTGLTAGQRPLVLSDGVFAATGRIAPVPEYIDILSRYPGAILLLDDAHGVGVLGDHGRGTFEYFETPSTQVNQSLTRDAGVRLYACGTLSKALGGYGGIIAGSEGWIARLKSTSHQYDGCSAPPAPIAAASACALRLMLDDPTPRLKLHHNTQRLRAGLLRIGLDVEDLPTPIVLIDLGDGDLMRRIQNKLLERGIAIGFLRYSGTPAHGALRIAVSALHTPEMIDTLVGRLRESL